MPDFMNEPTRAPLPPPPPPSQGPPPPYPPQYPQQFAPQYPPQYPQYGAYQPQGYPPFAAQGRTSGLAIASMVLGILWVYWIGSILAVIFGHVAINQAKKDPTLRGKGMAIAGLVLGYLGIAFLVLTIAVVASAPE